MSNNTIERIIETWERINALKNYLRHLEDLLDMMIRNSTIPEQGETERVKWKKYIQRSAKPIIESDVIKMVREIAPESLIERVHPSTLAKLVDMQLIPESMVRIIEEEKIKFEYLDEEIQALTREQILKEMNLI